MHPNVSAYILKYTLLFVRRLFLLEKIPGGHADTVEKGLGPGPLGPIGLIFRRTITVTGEVQFVEGP